MSLLTPGYWAYWPFESDGSDTSGNGRDLSYSLANIELKDGTAWDLSYVNAVEFYLTRNGEEIPGTFQQITTESESGQINLDSIPPGEYKLYGRFQDYGLEWSEWEEYIDVGFTIAYHEDYAYSDYYSLTVATPPGASPKYFKSVVSFSVVFSFNAPLFNTAFHAGYVMIATPGPIKRPIFTTGHTNNGYLTHSLNNQTYMARDEGWESPTGSFGMSFYVKANSNVGGTLILPLSSSVSVGMDTNGSNWRLRVYTGTQSIYTEYEISNDELHWVVIQQFALDRLDITVDGVLLKSVITNLAAITDGEETYIYSGWLGPNVTAIVDEASIWLNDSAGPPGEEEPEEPEYDVPPVMPINPHVILQWSDDGGITWSNEHLIPCGRIGEFRKRMKWNRLGRAKNRVFRVVVSEPCKWVFTSALMDAEIGNLVRG